MKCANCPNDAVFTVTHPASKPVNYCHRCIPMHLRQRADVGHFPLQAPLKDTTPAAAPKKGKKKPTIVEEPVVEEPEAAEEVSEEASSEDL